MAKENKSDNEKLGLNKRMIVRDNSYSGSKAPPRPMTTGNGSGRKGRQYNDRMARFNAPLPQNFDEKSESI